VPGTLVFLVNPSRRVRADSFQHAAQIVRAVASPGLAVVGIYEQRTIDDGHPFDLPFIQTKTPPLPSHPAAPKLTSCGGTTFQKDECQKQQASQDENYAEAVNVWEQRTSQTVQAWNDQTVAHLERLSTRGKTEESPNWDLRGALLKADQILAAEPAPRQCVVPLGGLVVRRPPGDLPGDLLRKTTLIVPGWQGTRRVQQEWNHALPYTMVKFLPQAVTDLGLVDAVTNCLHGTS
jgi:hypothetical protein